MKVLLLCTLILLPFVSHAQDMVMEYDKLSGVIKYYKVVHEKDTMILRPVKQPSLKKGNVLELRLKNINEYVYHAKTVSRYERDTLRASSFGSTFTTFMSASTGFLDELDLGGFDLGGIMGMLNGGIKGAGGESISISQGVSDQLLANAYAMNRIRNDLDLADEEIARLNEIRTELLKLKLSRNIPLSEIRSKKDSLLEHVLNDDPELLTPSYVRHLQRRVLQDLDTARTLAQDKERLLASIAPGIPLGAVRRGQFQLKEIDQRVNSIDLDMTLTEIRSLEQDIERARFQFHEQIVIDDADATDLLVDVTIFDQTRTADPIIEEPPGKVITYHPDRFMDPDGNIVSGPCEGCEPLKSSEGYVSTVQQENTEQGRSGTGRSTTERPYGIWRYWDTEGRLIEERNLGTSDDSPQYRLASNGLTPHLDERKTIRLNLNRGILFTTSVGISVSSLFEAPATYTTIDAPGSPGRTIILEDRSANVSPVISTFFHFHFDGPDLVQLGGHVGLGASLSDKTDLHMFLGPSILIGHRQKLALNMGLAATRTDRLRSSLTAGQPVDNDLLSEREVTIRQNALGWFAGLSFIMGMK